MGGVLVLKCFDVGLAWNWEYDIDFIRLLEREIIRKGLKCLDINPSSIDEVFRAVDQNEVTLKILMDRASDTDLRFYHFSMLVRDKGTFCLDNAAECRCWGNKANMHALLRSSSILVPRSFILPPYNRQTDTAAGWPDLGIPFVVKPAVGGGGEEVVTGARTRDDVVAVCEKHPDQYILLQQFIPPAILNGRPAWFRSIYCLGSVECCWWDPSTHVYKQLTHKERSESGLEPLESIVRQIAGMTGLNFFSTEIVLTADHRFVAIDYVNDIIDLRFQSKARDGIPEPVVIRLTDLIVAWMLRKCSESDAVADGMMS